MNDQSITELEAAVERLTAERDLAREDCGHQRAMKESIRTELNMFIRLKREADADAARLRGVVEQMVSALDRTEQNFKLAVMSKPVRDMCENLAENAVALAAAAALGATA